MIRRPLAAAALALCGFGAAACGGGEATGTGAAAPAASPPAAARDTASGTAGGTAAGSADGTPATPDTGAASPVTRTASESAARPLSGKVVVIDPGHNGGNFRHTREINRQVNILTQKKACDTTGTSTNDGYTEAAFTWDVSNRLARLLRDQGATVRLTRADNTGWGPCINQRAAIGNKAHADAAISIHGDGAAPGAHGFHVIMPKKIGGPVDPVVGDSQRLGRKVRDAFHNGTGLPYSTYIGRQALNYRSDLGGLNLSTVPKIFIECGNMRNAGEARRFRDASFRQTIAESLAKGLKAYLTTR
ncbi:N-acetylmuramoyl-L-alanine amidase [Microbispora triticiradicis]|uniref:N-acetylmuramoyl-L-alanine amidase n=2 Tax=Microbispora TaxID=2005 RepID=A0ABY3LVV7_9ACTN|nr:MULTISPECIES: N-acetylmuramoyl-L-alanine amidase [Microbispora]TLP57962.1 N-acetylmuramoyl-L-alanine amidase [Microbispora fusca]TYB56265.1 N-acetylmuramoyl-L-alanine amidase [Microbispora tritici]